MAEHRDRQQMVAFRAGERPQPPPLRAHDERTQVREREIELGGATWNIPTAHKILALLTEALDIAGDGTLP